MPVVVLDTLPSGWTGWTGLRLYQNEEVASNRLIYKHQLIDKQTANAKKQARQLKYCLQQAQEYWAAANTAAVATRPLQLYYCSQSLAMSQILWNGDGDSSLDRLRQSEAHHGLSFYWTGKKFEPDDLGRLIARPHEVSGRRKGTFDVWHRFAREGNLVGKERDLIRNTEKVGVLLHASSERLPLIQSNGISFLELISSLPQMESALNSIGLRTKTIRGTLSKQVKPSTVDGYQEIETFKLIMHPGAKECLSEFADQVFFSPSLFENLQVSLAEDSFGGFVCDFYNGRNTEASFSLPDGISMTHSVCYFKPFLKQLNEFGILYVGCFILGMICRYYPELWMAAVEQNSVFFYLAEQFLSIASARLPLLTLGVLADSDYIESGIRI